MFTKLLVGLDGSPQAQVALAQAISVGGRFRSTIVVAHVARLEAQEERLYQTLGAPWTEGRPTPLARSAQTMEEAAGKLLEDAAGAVRRAGLPVETVYRAGEVAVELFELSAGVDAVFVGRVGLRGVSDPLGPDTRELIRRAPTPLVVCGTVVSAMNRCGVAYDGEASSREALALAARYAEVAGAHLDVIHSTRDEAKGREILARAAMALSAAPVHFETHLERGDVHEAVANAVRRLDCNALFAGTHREEGRWSVPSHTEAILRATDIPVVVHSESEGLSARASTAHRRPPS
ncbi:MAG: universal stress protein [Gemmatimonadales bacterium]